MKVNARVRPEDIDKLLNSFLDGELPVRQLTEVQRLLNGNKKLARRLDQLRKCRAMLAAVPYVQAPAGIVDGVKAALAADTAHIEKAPRVADAGGRKELMLRRLLTAAAMFALVAVLAGVVYTIVSPGAPPGDPASERIAKVPKTPSPVSPGEFAAQIRGKLELTTASFAQADAAMNMAIRDTELDEFVTIDRLPRKTLYTFTCSRARLDSLLTRVERDWPIFESATFVLQSDTADDRVAVAGVTLDQIADIFSQDSLGTCARAAKYYAVANGASENPEAPGEVPIPRPVLTGDSPPDDPNSQTLSGDTTVSLTMVLAAQE